MPRTLIDTPAPYRTRPDTRMCPCCFKSHASSAFDRAPDGHYYTRCQTCRSRWGDSTAPNGSSSPAHPPALVIAMTDDLTVLAECWNDCVEAGPHAIRRAILRLEELLATMHNHEVRNRLAAGIREVRDTGSVSLLSHWLSQCRMPCRTVA